MAKDPWYGLPNQRAISPKPAQTEVIFCAGIEWDSEYNHTVLFESEGKAVEHCAGKCPSKAEPYHLMYNAPVSIGKMRVKMPAVETRALNINYMIFNNAGLYDRWVFCFITGMNWLSDNDCEISFKLDVFQMCAYRCNYKPCFVEREHVMKSEDKLGAYLLPENLDTGELSTMKSDAIGFGNMGIGVLTTESVTGKDVEGKIIGGVYQGAQLTYLTTDGETTAAGLANGLINSYNNAGKIDAVLNVYMIPNMCYNEEEVTYNFTADGAFNGYRPKNNKLWSYPYCYCLVDNNIGTTGVFKFELDNAKGNAVRFSMRGELSPLPSVMLRPLNYANINGISYQSAITYSQFAQCSFNSDVARAWVAQNKNTLALSVATAALEPVKGAISGAMNNPNSLVGAAAGTASGLVSAGEQIAGLMAAQADREIEPAQIHGKCDNTNINHAFGLTHFSFYLMSCLGEVAKSIDDYFSAFGYTIKRIKTPNITGRTSWNYVKTIGCGFDGNLPPEMLREFRTIFDRGVTIWHTTDVGNYSLNND